MYPSYECETAGKLGWGSCTPIRQTGVSANFVTLFDPSQGRRPATNKLTVPHAKL